jgi:hypothetical protein
MRLLKLSETHYINIDQICEVEISELGIMLTFVAPDQEFGAKEPGRKADLFTVPVPYRVLLDKDESTAFRKWLDLNCES